MPPSAISVTPDAPTTVVVAVPAGALAMTGAADEPAVPVTKPIGLSKR